MAALRLFWGLSLLRAWGWGSLHLSLVSMVPQEEDFIRPSSREEAQQLWEAEKIKMRQVLDKQQKQMLEDSQWLRQEEKSLVSQRRAWRVSLPSPGPSASH